MTERGHGAGAAERMAVAQGAFYLATGLWPVLHLRSFEAVTGPKADGWLVKTVGGLIGVVGGALLSAGLHRRQRGRARWTLMPADLP